MAHPDSGSHLRLMSNDYLQSLLKVEHLQLYLHFLFSLEILPTLTIMALKCYSLSLMPNIYLLCTSAISYVVNHIFQVHLIGGRHGGSRELPVLQFEAKSRFPHSRRYVSYFTLKLQNLMHSTKEES